MARLLCTRLLQRLAPPLEAAEVETWLEGVRIELGDTVAVSSDFHGWDRDEFTVLGKNLDLGRRRVQLKLSRPWTAPIPGPWTRPAAPLTPGPSTSIAPGTTTGIPGAMSINPTPRLLTENRKLHKGDDLWA